jgi:hypothetical protein
MTPSSGDAHPPAAKYYVSQEAISTLLLDPITQRNAHLVTPGKLFVKKKIFSYNENR